MLYENRFALRYVGATHAGHHDHPAIFPALQFENTAES
jgi:hypothetical protein